MTARKRVKSEHFIYANFFGVPGLKAALNLIKGALLSLPPSVHMLGNVATPSVTSDAAVGHKRSSPLPLTHLDT